MKKNKKRMRLLMLLLSLFTIFSTFAQNCDCEENLKFLASKTERNYPGFLDKVNQKTKVEFQKLYQQLLKEAHSKKGISCYYLLNDYLRFFHDQHLNISVSVARMDTANLRFFFSTSPKFIFDTVAFKNKISRRPKDIEGIWELKSSAGYYRIAITKHSANKFTGVILNADNIYWEPFQIKVKAFKMHGGAYGIKYFLKDHSILEETIAYNNSGELAMNNSIWKRVYPKTSEVNAKVNNQKQNGFYFKKISKQTCLLRLPNFFLQNKKEIDSLIKYNRADIDKTENLIIDIRNNPGGTVYAYRELVKYFYTNPIHLQTGLYKASEDNILYYKSKLNDTSSSGGYKKSLISLIEKLEANKGQLVDADSAESYTEDLILPYPKKIAIVANRNCSSAAELFLLDFRQSSKTIIFGENTRGVVDYLNGRLNQPLPCDNYNYSYPLLKRKDATIEPIDNIGIKPHIVLKTPESGWINKIQQYLEHGKK